MDASPVIANHPVVPVVVVDDPAKAVTLAEIFLQNNLHCIEVTLRTPNALSCIEAMVNAFPNATIGAGSVVTPEQLRASVAVGSQFAVSPGSSTELLQAAANDALVPGAATATEVMQLKSAGYRTVKFFPAELLGGIKTIRALCDPISDVQFFPTGGIRESNLQDYLQFDRVACVGGSWLAPSAEVEADAWGAIQKRCESLQAVLSQQ